MVLMHPDLTEQQFLHKAGAKSGYAKQMFTDMYNSITSELIDVISEFERFYSFEYKTFEGYLYKKYNFEEEVILDLTKVMKENPNCRLYRKDEHSYGKYEIASFTTSDTMRDRITEILLTN